MADEPNEVEFDLEAEEDRPEDIGDARDVSARKKRAAAAREAYLETLRTLMGGPVGRAFIFEILSRCHLGQNLFNRDALIMAHNCGEHNIGNSLLIDISVACPDSYMVMMKENQNG